MSDTMIVNQKVAPIFAQHALHTPIAYLERTAARTPDKVAVVDEAGTCTFAELLILSRRAASAIACRRGADAGGPLGTVTPFPVVVFMEKGIDMLAAFMGTLMAGGFYVPVDPAAPAARAAGIFSTLVDASGTGDPGAAERHAGAAAGDAPAPLVIANAATIEGARAVFPAAEVVDVEDLMAKPVDRDLLVRRARTLIDTDPAYVLFTSGSTGVPKGVAVSHRAICGFIDSFVDTFGIRETDVLGNQAPFDFDVSVKDIYSALATGATLSILPRRLFSAPAELVAAVRDRGVTVMVWAAAALCLVTSLHALDDAELPQVRLVMFSGEVMPRRHLERWLERLPEATFVNLYGPTEITCNCLYHVVDRTRAYRHGLPLGEPFANRRVLVLDEQGRPVGAPGAVGELYVGGPNIALGYLGNPERTAAAFVRDPVAPATGGTVYRTGDMVRVGEAGELFFCGRTDNQIKHQGHRIELEEIDAAFEALPGVDRCRCVYHEQRKRIYAFFEGDAEEAPLRQAVAERLPQPMMPARIIPIEQMPLSKNGKVDRRALLERVATRRRAADPRSARRAG